MSHGHSAGGPSPVKVELEGQLIEQTVARREEILSKADKKANEIIAEAEKQAESIVKEANTEMIKALDFVIRGVRDRIIGSTEIEGRKILMIERDKQLDSIYLDAAEKIKAEYLEKARRNDVLVKLTVEACSAIGGEHFIVSSNEVDQSYLKRSKLEEEVRKASGSNAKIEFDENFLPTVGGVIVRNGDGTKIYFNTLESRIEKAKTRLNARIAKSIGA